MNNIRTAANEIIRVAERLEKRGHELAPELRKIAQYMMTDPMVGEQPMMGEQFQPSAGGAFHPLIQPFAQMKEVVPVDDRDIHTCSITFKLPKGVSQADIMRMILQNCEDMGAEADGFQWQRKESKKS